MGYGAKEFVHMHTLKEPPQFDTVHTSTEQAFAGNDVSRKRHLYSRTSHLERQQFSSDRWVQHDVFFVFFFAKIKW
jgi:hypothetical protein